MSRLRPCLVPAAVAALVLPVAGASAQCGFINFENLPVNTAVTNQYPGVVFSGRNSGGGPGSPPRIFSAGIGTSSPSRALIPEGDGINEFSCDYMRMDFTSAQQMVSFAVGVMAGCTVNDTTQVRWYDGAGTLLGSVNYPLNGLLNSFCGRQVRLGSRTGPFNISRIEVQYGVSPLCSCAYEMIDDLEYDIDTTPPVAIIADPAPFSCVCDLVTFRGTADDPDGTYNSDRLEYASNPGGPWTLIGSATSPAPGPDSALYNWNTSALPTGHYFLRLTVTSDCGTDSEFVTVIHVDNSPPGIDLRAPAAGAVLGGQVCFDGTVNDGCSLTGYTMMYRPVGVGPFNPIDPATPTYTSAVINDPLGGWQTASGPAAVPDGTYTIRITATDSCGQASTLNRNIVVDNTAPVALITNPVSCSTIDQGLIQIHGTASDLHMGGWSVQYTGGDAHDWVTIATGNANVVNGLLATWDARNLRDCCYAIRLVVTDAVSVSCSSGHRSEYTVALGLGAARTQDYNGDGLVNSQDFFDFLTIFFNGCP